MNCLFSKTQCPIVGCKNMLNKNQLKCKLHIGCSNCAYDNCNNLSRDYDLCVVHKCNIFGCKNVKSKIGSNTCESHTCKAPVCTSVCIGNSSFCVEHKCCVNDCYKYNNKNEYNVCYLHKCSNTNCKKNTKHYKSQDYCDDHACINPYCSNMKHIGSEYCMKHKCKISECIKGCMGDNSDYYCPEHYRLHIKI